MLGDWFCTGGIGEWARAGSVGNGGGGWLVRSARPVGLSSTEVTLGADALRGLGPLGLRTALRVALAGEAAELDRRIAAVEVRKNRLRLAAGCSGEVAERPKLSSLPLAISMVCAAVAPVVWV